MTIHEREIRAHLDRLTKPRGSLGRLEDLACELARIQGATKPATRPRRCVIFAADHGVVAEGVGAWPSDVTRSMIDNIRAGGAASCTLARACGAELHLVDVGSLHPALEGDDTFFVERVRRGSRNLAVEDALSADEWSAASAIGARHARRAHADGMRLVVAGEMGIGNTTSTAALAMLMLDLPVELAVGRGAGANDAQLEKKRRVVARAVERARPGLVRDPLGAVASVGGLEIAALAGFYTECARLGLACVLDGVVATAAALAAETLASGAVRTLIASHRSVEPAHAPMLAHIRLQPYLEWNLRLGEGTGALLLVPLLDAAAEMIGGMATFESAGIERA